MMNYSKFYEKNLDARLNSYQWGAVFPRWIGGSKASSVQRSSSVDIKVGSYSGFFAVQVVRKADVITILSDNEELNASQCKVQGESLLEQEKICS